MASQLELLMHRTKQEIDRFVWVFTMNIIDELLSKIATDARNNHQVFASMFLKRDSGDIHAVDLPLAANRLFGFIITLWKVAR